jgi:3-dehydroquinate synthetase
MEVSCLEVQDAPLMPHESITCFNTPLLPSSPYYSGRDIVGQFPDFLRRHDFDRCFLVTSRKLLRFFGQEFLDVLMRARVRCAAVVIKETERHKDWRTLRRLCEELVARGATKDSVLIAVGGGTIGNIVGLAAALLYRGVRFVAVPTTTMAQTDSTLSNKQAINGRRGKNHFGVYHAPLFIWSDAAYPAVEPARQQRSGIVEGIKNVLISQASIAAIEPMLAARDAGRIEELLRLLIESKLAILRRDPSERGSCVILEYGHTFGHAIEWLSAGRLFHGEAVAIGMCLAAELSHTLGFMSEEFLRDHYCLLGERLGAPTRVPADISMTAIYETMLADNKRTKKGLRVLLLRDCGEFVNPDGDFQVAVAPEHVLSIPPQRIHSPTRLILTSDRLIP